MLSRSPATPPLRIAILGAGPIGLEAAIYGRSLGHDIAVFEQGDVAHAVQSWRHVRMFSPWGMNQTPLGQRRLVLSGYSLPDGAASPTGQDLLEQYLLPLSRDPLLSGRLRLHSRVVAVGRNGLLKGDLIGQLGRTRHPFRLLIEDRTGEHVEHADVVLDSTGTYTCPNAIGDGGVPAPGERWLGDRLLRHIPDVLGRDRKRLAGRRILVAGGGLSAATAVCALSRLCAEVPGTEVTWAVRREGLVPYKPIADDPLPGRAQLMREANELARAGAVAEGAAARPSAASATSGARPVRFLHGTFVDGMSAEGHRLRVRLRTPGGHFQDELCDEVIGLTGYGPDNSLYRELQVHECYATRGPMKLATQLLAAAVPGGDCLAQPVPAADTLKNPEPGFYLLGQKSYGKQRDFLLRAGHEQVRNVYRLLHGSATLDLYEQLGERQLEPAAAAL